MYNVNTVSDDFVLHFWVGYIQQVLYYTDFRCQLLILPYIFYILAIPV